MLPPAPDAIELRHLRAFVAVAEELNFGRAATRLFVSQPALSRQIRGLERLVGCDLLRRSTHRVELTLAGDALLDRARGLLSDLDDAVHATRSVGGDLERRLAAVWEPINDLTAASPDLQALRDAGEQLHGQFELAPGMSVRPVIAGGVPSLLVTPRPEERPTILLLHGGGFVMGSAFGYRHLASAIAAAADTGVIVPDFRLAPEHPYPAALEDALRTLRLDARQRGAAGADRGGRRLGGRRAGALAGHHPRPAGPPATRRHHALLPGHRPHLHRCRAARRTAAGDQRLPAPRRSPRPTSATPHRTTTWSTPCAPT